MGISYATRPYTKRCRGRDGISCAIAARPDPLVRLQSQLDFLQQHLADDAALIVLPESAIVNPKLFPERVGLFHRLAIERRLSFVVGVAQATKFDQPPVTLEPDKPQLRSEAWILQRHSKIRFSM